MHVPRFKVSCTLSHAPHNLILMLGRKVKVVGAARESNNHVRLGDMPDVFQKVPDEMDVIEVLAFFYGHSKEFCTFARGKAPVTALEGEAAVQRWLLIHGFCWGFT